MSVDPDDVTRTLAGLVRINSINPAFGEGRTNESEIAWHVAALLSGLGMEVTTLEPEPGRVSVLDKGGRTVATLGTNESQGEINTNKVEPAQWHEGIVTSPHGITFDAEGDILVTEWNKTGRVLRWNRKP